MHDLSRGNNGRILSTKGHTEGDGKKKNSRSNGNTWGTHKGSLEETIVRIQWQRKGEWSVQRRVTARHHRGHSRPHRLKMFGWRRHLRRYLVPKRLWKVGPEEKRFEDLCRHRSSWLQQDEHVSMGIYHTERDIWRRNGRTNNRDTIPSHTGRVHLQLHYRSLHLSGAWHSHINGPLKDEIPQQ